MDTSKINDLVKLHDREFNPNDEKLITLLRTAKSVDASLLKTGNRILLGYSYVSATEPMFFACEEMISNHENFMFYLTKIVVISFYDKEHDFFVIIEKNNSLYIISRKFGSKEEKEYKLEESEYSIASFKALISDQQFRVYCEDEFIGTKARVMLNDYIKENIPKKVIDKRRENYEK